MLRCRLGTLEPQGIPCVFYSDFVVAFKMLLFPLNSNWVYQMTAHAS